MNKEKIQDILDKLGSSVSYLSEENRICKLRDDAGRKFILQLEPYISSEEWVKIYESTDDTFVKDLMKEWGMPLFPKDYVIR